MRRKINPKNFTESQAIDICIRQNCMCAVCGKRAALLTEDNEIIWVGNIHHIKYKSSMTKKDLELGPAGSILNGVLVHQHPCHNRIHSGDISLRRFRTRSWQNIGETEEDL